jgi:hypothetical protein
LQSCSSKILLSPGSWKTRTRSCPCWLFTEPSCSAFPLCRFPPSGCFRETFLQFSNASNGPSIHDQSSSYCFLFSNLGLLVSFWDILPTLLCRIPGTETPSSNNSIFRKLWFWFRCGFFNLSLPLSLCSFPLFSSSGDLNQNGSLVARPHEFKWPLVAGFT